MGRKQKAKATRAAEQPCLTSTVTSQPGKRTEKQIGCRDAQPTGAGHICIASPPIPSCQALVDKDCRAKCGGISASPDGKWCEYHSKMRLDLHKSFHELLQAYQSTSDAIPDMALMKEAVDLDWVEGYWEPLYTRIDVLNKALLCRTCFMDRLQGDDLDFKSKKYIKGLREARTRLQSNLRTIEDRMFILIACTSEAQNSIATISAQLFCRIDQQHQRCIHHDAFPDSDIRTFMFPIDRQYRHQLMANFQGSVIDGYIAAELRRFRIELLEKLGVQVIRPTDYENNDHYKLIVHWDSLEELRRAHIAAAYFRRLCFIESHLFVQAHHHTRALENGRLPCISVENPRGCYLDFEKDMDPALLCMVTFLLSPHLKLSHLGILRDYLWWPAWSEVRTAVQDVYIDEDAYMNGKPPVRPWWSKPPAPASFAAFNECDDPQGVFTLLCGMLYEASYPQAHRDDVITYEYWPHFGSLIRCGKCLLSMAWSSDEWFAIVRAFSIRRTPMYSRIFPQVQGDGAGGSWTSDLVTDLIRGQSNLGLASHREHEKDQVPTGPDFDNTYRLDETLEIAGVVMLGVVTGGPVVSPDVVDSKQRRFLESFKVYPQIWFLLTSDRNPKYKDFVISIVHQLVLRACRRGSDLMIKGVAIEHPEIEQDLLNVPAFHNASQRRPGAAPWWEPMNTGFDLLRAIAGLKYDPVPHRLMGDCPMIHLACRPANPGGVRWLLDVLLEAAIEASSVRTKAELEELWIKSETGWAGRGTGPGVAAFSYRFGPWHDEDAKKKDAAVQTSSTRLGDEDWPSNTLISGLQELHAGTVETILQQTPLHDCRSHMPPHEFTDHHELSRGTLTVSCSMPVRLFQAPNLPAHEPHNLLSFSTAETSAAVRSSNPEPTVDHRDEHHPRRERDIFSEFVPPIKTSVQVTHIDWFDLVMSEEGNQLPDLSDWRAARKGHNLLLREDS
ncbi:hypothetical protein OPQ81_010956 [Rhizoctonia solani]|nr:hypothetical protein OPQ81_010956 [Rhizoctonia solani]